VPLLHHHGGNSHIRLSAKPRGNADATKPAVLSRTIDLLLIRMYLLAYSSLFVVRLTICRYCTFLKCKSVEPPFLIWSMSLRRQQFSGHTERQAEDQEQLAIADVADPDPHAIVVRCDPQHSPLDFARAPTRVIIHSVTARCSFLGLLRKRLGSVAARLVLASTTAQQRCTDPLLPSFIWTLKRLVNVWAVSHALSSSSSLWFRFTERRRLKPGRLRLL
jgi:hypothetical protein